MSPDLTPSPARARRSARHLVAFIAALALAAGCEEKKPLNVGISSNSDGGGGSAGSGAGAAGGSAGTAGNAGTASQGGAGAGAGMGGGGTGGVAPQPATFIVSLDQPSATLKLRDKAELNVIVEPNGYKGTVALAVDKVGADVSAELGAAMVELDGVTKTTTLITLTTLSSTPPGDSELTVSGTVETGTKTGSSTVTVQSDITIMIPKGVNGMKGTLDNPNKTAFGDYPTMITAPAGISDQNPVKVRFYNADDVSHEIHANKDGAGFPHSPGPIAPGSMETLVRKVNTAGTYDFYLHDQGSAFVVGRIVIK